MKRFVAVVVVGALTWVGIDLLADLTQTRPEPARRGSSTGVTFSVRTRDDRPAPVAAQTLWGACQFMVRRHVAEPGIVPLGGDRFYVELRPEIGAAARQRLHGCLEDGTIDIVRGRVIDMQSWGPGESRPAAVPG